MAAPTTSCSAGRRTTPKIEAEVDVRTAEGRIGYRFALESALGDRFVVAEEAYRIAKSGKLANVPWEQIEDSGYPEARIAERTNGNGPQPEAARAIVGLLRRCPIYQFHDTSFDSRMKVSWDSTDSGRLRGDGANLASVLSLLEREDKPRFELICRYIGLAVPVFDRFQIKEEYGKVQLRWKHKDMDKTMGAHMTSDGMLRFFALATLLNLPPEMLPGVLLLDEPELGLHPAAITLIGAMHCFPRGGSRATADACWSLVVHCQARTLAASRIHSGRQLRRGARGRELSGRRQGFRGSNRRTST